MQRLLSRLIWVIAGVLIAAALAQLVLMWLPVSTGLRRSDQFERWPLQNTAARQPYSYSITWSMRNAHRGKTNNYGHVAPFDFRRHSAPIVVIGDSFVESLMNDYADTLQGQLGDLIQAPEHAYGLGVSGLSASDYVALSRLARDEFQPRAAVIVVSDGDLSESLYPAHGSYFLVPNGADLELKYDPVRNNEKSGEIWRALADSSLHRYFQVNLQFSPEKLVGAWQREQPPASSGKSVGGLSLYGLRS